MGLYLYILFPFFVWVISQTIKFFVRLAQKEVSIKLKGLWWVYVWAGGAPSTHAAILISSLVLVWHNFGFSPLFTFCLAITMLWLFDIVAQRKRQVVLNSYFARDNSTALQEVVNDGYMIDLSGHALHDVVLSVRLGIALGAIGVYMLGL